MKRFVLFGLAGLSLALAQDPLAPPPPPLEEKALPGAPAGPEAIEEPEDLLETLLAKAAKFYDEKKRAKCGGALLEAAELVQDLAQPQPQRVVDEVAALRQLALLGAQDELQHEAVDFAAARAYVKLAALLTDKAMARYENGKHKDAGQDWYRAVLFVERGLDRGGYGLKDAGIDTLTESKNVAESMAQGDLVETETVRPLLADTRNMVGEIGRSLAAKSGVTWEQVPLDPRKVGGVIEDTSRKAVDKVRGGVQRLGDALRRWNR